MRVKFALYGAGIRGRRAMEMIGKENVVCFVDGNEEKIGNEFCDIPIIAPDKLTECDKNTVCIITPKDDVDIIDAYLRSLGIHFIMHEPAFEHILALYKDHIINDLLTRCNGRRIGIFGISAGSLILYEDYVKRYGEKCILIPGKTQTIDQYSYLNDYYNLSDFSGIKGNIDVLVNTEAYFYHDLAVETISAQSIFERIIPYSNDRIRSMKKSHEGERCFIVATGPSLRPRDLDKLYEKHEITISMNRIYNIFDRTTWRPDYYVIEDPFTIRELLPQIVNLDLPIKFLPQNMGEYWMRADMNTSIPLNNKIIPSEEMHRPLFSENIEKSIYCGYTVTYTCLQIAVHLGFKEIYLIGVDYNFSSNLHDQCNHFPGYEKDGVTTVCPFYKQKSGLSYLSAKEYTEHHGIKVFNATRGGQLEFFERVDFDSLF